MCEWGNISMPGAHRRGYQIPRSGSFRWLYAVVWVVGTGSMSSAEAALNHWNLSSPQSMSCIVCNHCMLIFGHHGFLAAR